MKEIGSFDLPRAHLVPKQSFFFFQKGPEEEEETSAPRSLGDDSRHYFTEMKMNAKSVLVLLRFSPTKGINWLIKAAVAVIRLQNKNEQ